MAELISIQGGKVLAISDRSGAIINEDGLDILALRRHMRASPPFGGHLNSFPGGQQDLSIPFHPPPLPTHLTFSTCPLTNLKEQGLQVMEKGCCSLSLLACNGVPSAFGIVQRIEHLIS